VVSKPPWTVSKPCDNPVGKAKKDLVLTYQSQCPQAKTKIKRSTTQLETCSSMRIIHRWLPYHNRIKLARTTRRNWAQLNPNKIVITLPSMTKTPKSKQSTWPKKKAKRATLLKSTALIPMPLLAQVKIVGLHKRVSNWNNLRASSYKK